MDGQQRSIALSKTKNKALPVPVVAFVSDDINVHREQFILVNKAKPLSPRLVDELLPEIDAYLPRDLAQRQIPSELCNLLNHSPISPFKGLIKRPSSPNDSAAVVNDRVLISAIRRRIENPLGALAQFRISESEGADVSGMFKALVSYWSAVKAAFPDAWGRDPSQSRLMHSAGIEAMSTMMDRFMAGATSERDASSYLKSALSSIGPQCCWTRGRWPDIDRSWNDIEYTPRDVKLLTEQLVRLDRARLVAQAA